MATVRLQLRRGTEAQWDTANPTLAAGEIGIETDTNTFKFGDGSTPWNSLSYALSQTVDDYILLSTKGVANGVASLDSSGFIPSAQLPPLAKVTVSAVANQAARLALTAESGDIAIQSDTGTTYVLASSPASTDGNWRIISATAAISAAIATHEADTTSVHGIADTSLLATTANVATAKSEAQGYADSQINLVLGAAPAALNTLVELASALGNDANFAGSVTNSLASKLDSSVAATTYAPLASPTLTGTVTLPESTSIGNVSNLEIGYVNGVTSSIQGQMDTKLASTIAASTYAPLVSPTLTGTVTLPESTSIGQVSNLEIGYVNGVTSSIQGQIDEKLASATAATTYAPLASPTLTGTVTLPESTSIGLVSNIEIGYVNGVTSGIQGQIDLKAPLESPTFTGVVTLPANTISQSMMGDDSVGTNEIGGFAVTEAKLALNSVTESKIADGSVTSAKIATGTIVDADINASAAIAQSKIDGLSTSFAAKADLASPTFTGTVSGITKTMVGLANVDNTADSAKPVSTATQTALDLKANRSAPTFTGTVTASNDLVVDGNLTVNGTTFNASSTSIVIEDNMVQLAHQNAANVVDLGLVVAYNDGAAKHAGLVRDVSDAKWKLFKGVTTEPSTTVDFTQGSLDDLKVAAFEATTVTPSSGVVFSDGTQTKVGVPSLTVIGTEISAAYNLSTGGLTLRDQLIPVAGARAITIPTNATTAFPIGTSIDFYQASGTGGNFVAADGTVTILRTPGLTLRTTHSSATLTKVATNTWLLAGDLTA